MRRTRRGPRGAHRRDQTAARALLAWADAAEAIYRHGEGRLSADLGKAGATVEQRERRTNRLALLWLAREG